MNGKRKLILVGLLLLIGLIGCGYFYTFHSPHRNISEEKAFAELKAPELLYQFKKKDTNSDSYANRVIIVSGSITSIDRSTIIINGMVQVDLLGDTEISINNGESIMIKGRCVGYDELLEVVKMDQATILTK